jgi:hypothetical protein
MLILSTYLPSQTITRRTHLALVFELQLRLDAVPEEPCRDVGREGADVASKAAVAGGANLRLALLGSAWELQEFSGRP